MSAERESKHFGFAVMMFAIIGAILYGIVTGMGSLLSGDGHADMSAPAIAKRIAPVGELNTGAAIVPAGASAPAAAPATTKERSGKEIFNAVCTACHSSGALGAPKIGNKADWGPRIKKGIDTLLNHAEHGFNKMPPRGTCADCSNAELKKTIEYMISKVK